MLLVHPQGGPHNHQIGALCVALKYAQTPEFKRYARQVRANSVALAEALKARMGQWGGCRHAARACRIASACARRG